MVVYRFFRKDRVDFFLFYSEIRIMNVYLEIFGYIGTALIILSMMMKSINKLRILNMSGSVISVIYSILSDTWPTVLLNACLIAVNVYHLAKYYVEKKKLNNAE